MKLRRCCWKNILNRLPQEKAKHDPCDISIRKDEHDLCDISVPKTAAESPRPRDGLRGGGTGRPHRAVARQSHLLVPLAQRVAAPAATRSLHRPRPNRHGRL